jgi:hypothetical protein
MPKRWATSGSIVWTIVARSSSLVASVALDRASVQGDRIREDARVVRAAPGEPDAEVPAEKVRLAPRRTVLGQDLDVLKPVAHPPRELVERLGGQPFDVSESAHTHPG